MDPPPYQDVTKSAWIAWLWKYNRRRFKAYLTPENLLVLESIMQTSESGSLSRNSNAKHTLINALTYDYERHQRILSARFIEDWERSLED